MCGIAGIWDREASSAEVLRTRLRAMMESIRYRGPDGDGLWLDPEAGLGLGHLRLAIQDLSPAGAQPMESASGRYVLTYNGEIYNVEELRASLLTQGWTFRGTSDTEIFLAALERGGLDDALARAAGMFAMGLWDRKERTLTLVRDRIGKKPLYVAEAGGTLLFGSELKALMAHPALKRNVDPQALAAFLRFGYVPGPLAIFQGVRKVMPGSYDRIHSDGRSETTVYWDLAGVAAAGARCPAQGSHEDLCDAAEAEIDRAVRERLVSDVPVGAFLSGGIDSSLIVTKMHAHAKGGARTFSIGFDEQDFDEAPFAEAIARHLGTNHTTLRVTSADALDVIPGLPAMYDEPFADSSQIPTHLVAKLARAEVTVALSGDGGDEIAGGYRRHYQINRWWPVISRIPLPLRRAVSSLAGAVPADTLDSLLKLAPGGVVPSNPVDKAQKLAALLAQDDPQGMYRSLVTLWPETAGVVAGHVPESPVDDAGAGAGLGLLGRLRYLDMATYLPDDILCKVDRASMAVALEARCPLLDHRVIEFFWTLPDSSLVRGRTGKVILRDILARHVPRPLFERPKTGFGIPLAAWLRGPLADWAQDLLSGERAEGDSPFDMKLVQATFDQHRSGRYNHQYRIWAVLMAIAWKRTYAATW